MSDGRTQIKKDNFKKNDLGKLEWNLMPDAALEEILKVFMHGAKTYGAYNWIDNADEILYSRILNSAERHLKAAKRGRDIDVESGLFELAHLGCNVLMLLTLIKQRRGKDDRRGDL